MNVVEALKTRKADTMIYICQYCEREFPTSEKLVSHELQHLVGNNFERAEYMSRIKKIDQDPVKEVNATTKEKQQQLSEGDQPKNIDELESKEKGLQSEVASDEFNQVTNKNSQSKETVESGMDVKNTNETSKLNDYPVETNKVENPCAIFGENKQLQNQDDQTVNSIQEEKLEKSHSANAKADIKSNNIHDIVDVELK